MSSAALALGLGLVGAADVVGPFAPPHAVEWACLHGPKPESVHGGGHCREGEHPPRNKREGDALAVWVVIGLPTFGC